MHVYKFRLCSNEIWNFYLENRVEAKRIGTLEYPVSLANWWEPITVSINRISTRSQLKSRADFLGGLPNVMILNEHAAESLSSLLLGRGELLPLDSDEGRWWWFNVTHTVDALDLDNCVVERFPDGRILDIRKYSFHATAVAEEVIFRSAQIDFSPIFVTDRFIDQAQRSGLTGLCCELLVSRN